MLFVIFIWKLSINRVKYGGPSATHRYHSLEIYFCILIAYEDDIHYKILFCCTLLNCCSLLHGHIPFLQATLCMEILTGLVMCCACFGSLNLAYSYHLCRAPDIAEAGTTLNVFWYIAMLVEIQTYHLLGYERIH